MQLSPPHRNKILYPQPDSAGGDFNLYAYVRNDPAIHKDPSGLDIVVIENGPTEGNPIGHTAVAISGRGVFSFGNGNEGDGSNIAGGGFYAYAQRESPRRRTAVWVIPTTPEQDERAFNMAISINGEPPLSFWRLFLDNCSLRSNRILNAAGITSPSNFMPSFLPGDAGHRSFMSGGNFYEIPKGPNVRINKGGFSPDYDFGSFEPRLP